jgi:rhodanese-related sulfurtransferase
MDQYIDFVGKNLMLFLLLATLVGMIIWTEFRRFTRGFQEISPIEAVTLINHEEALLLDVREDAELSQGRIARAKHIPLSVLKQRVEELNKYRGKPVITFCRSGNRSIEASTLLKKNEFEKVFHMKGGLIEWENANLPKS